VVTSSRTSVYGFGNVSSVYSNTNVLTLSYLCRHDVSSSAKVTTIWKLINPVIRYYVLF